MAPGFSRSRSALALFLALASLALGQQVPGAGQPPAQSGANQVGQTTSGVSQTPAVDPHGYKIGAQDVIQVRVWREPEVSGTFTVLADGKISMPLVKEIQAAGMTPFELEKQITEKLSTFIQRPDVNVTVVSVQSKKYSIIGSVNRTGSFPLVGPTTVLDALAGAGGFHEFANTKKITIARGAKRLRFNYNEVLKGKHPEQNIQLENGDLIIVP